MVEYFIQNELEHTHEREASLALAQLMRRAFGASERFYLLAANVRFWHAQADVLVLMSNALVSIELKSCGEAVYGRAHGTWHITGSGGARLRGGSYDNPYQQVSATRQALIKYVDRNRSRFLIADRAREMKGHWGQVSAAIVFSPRLHPDSDIVIPPESRTWLGIMGLNEVAEFLFSRFSLQLDLRPQELRKLATEVLGCQPWGEIETLLAPTPNYGRLWALDEEGRLSYTFPIPGEASIGRSRDNSLVIPARFSRTSRHHARLSLVGETVWLHDEGSTHGTFVNGEPVVPGQARSLREGDAISLGGLNQGGIWRLRFDRHLHLDTTTDATVGDHQVS
ncbi:MAG: FHA domain-containing protein [Thermoflexales bacterium]|nr:FHA domain-containing protein [Thermoflexales bacterium]